MTKQYIEKEYDQIIKEWKCAASEEERWLLRERMAKLERTAGSLLGIRVFRNRKNLNLIRKGNWIRKKIQSLKRKKQGGYDFFHEKSLKKLHKNKAENA